MRNFLITNLEKGNGTITEEQVLEIGGEVTADVVTEAEAQAMADATTQLDELRTQRFRDLVIFYQNASFNGSLQVNSTGSANMSAAMSVSVPNVSADLLSAVNLGTLNEATRIESTRPLLNTNFSTSTLIEGLPQYGKEINLQNTSAIEITVKSGAFSTYFKGGAGNIKFVADTGRTLKLMDATDTINGIVGSYAKVKSFGTVDYIYINNYE